MKLLSALFALAAMFLAAPAQAQAPGTLISAEPMTNAPAGMKAWRIRYTSTNDRGIAEQVTGVVIAPAGAPPKKGRPVLAWAHGSWGVVGKCTFSEGASFFSITPGLSDAIARGYVVVATDYAGLGTPQPHPYLVGLSAAHSVLDSVRAARSIPEAGASKRFAVWGESQGGHAALFTGEQASSYARELDLVGVAAAAPPTELADNLALGSDPSIRAFLTAYTADSWSRHYNVSLATLGKVTTQKLIQKLAQNCITPSKMPNLGTIVRITILRRDLKGVDLGKIDPWAGLARLNSAGSRPISQPLLIAQNAKDTIVAPDVTLGFARRACQRGTKIRYITMTTKGGHLTSGKDSAAETLNWIDQRFAGTAPPNDCGRF